MNQKQIGTIIIILGIISSAFVYMVKLREDFYIDNMVDEMGGSCILESGYCLHQDRDWTMYILGGIISIGLIILGVYLFFFDKTQKVLAENQVKVAEAIRESKKSEKFEAFLSGFSDEEKKVLKAIKEQDGIKQSTLRYRTDMSKTALSLMLKNLEERKILHRKPAGKTNQIFLIKKF